MDGTDHADFQRHVPSRRDETIYLYRIYNFQIVKIQTGTKNHVSSPSTKLYVTANPSKDLNKAKTSR